MKTLIMIVLLTICSSVAVGAPDCTPYGQLPAEIGSIPDDTIMFKILAVDGDYFCYATGDGSGTGLRLVWGRALPAAAPEVLGDFNSSAGWPTSLACEGSLVSVGFKTSNPVNCGWLLVDFSNPHHPVQRSQNASASEVVDQEMVGGLACIAALDDGFRFFDISDPTAPVEEVSLSDVDWALSVAEDAGVWYVGGRFGTEGFLRAYDLSAPAVPVLLGEFTTYATPTNGQMFDALDAEGGTVAARLDQYPPSQFGSILSSSVLKILDFSNPAAIEEVGDFSFGRPIVGQPAIGNGMIYAPSEGSVNYLTEVDGIWTRVYGIGVADNAHVEVVGERLLYFDNLRLVNHEGLLTVPPPAANILGAIPSVDFKITDTNAFFLEDLSDEWYDVGAIEVFDLSDPENPVFSHGFFINVGTPMFEVGFAIHGEYLHSTFGSFHWPTGDPVATDVEMRVDGLVVDDILYAIQSSGFRVYDLSIPDTPVAVGDHLGFSLSALDVLDGHLYALSGDPFGGEISVFDLASPLAPVHVSTVSHPEDIYHGTASGGYLYLVGNTGLSIYDLASWDLPVLVGQLPLGRCRDVEVYGKTAYVSAYQSGMIVVDVNSPSAPVLLGDYHSGAYAWQAEVDHGYVYLLGGTLTILGRECSDPAPVDGNLLPGNKVTAVWLDNPFPNPFNPRTEMQFGLERAGPVVLSIHDAAGRKVRTLVEEYREAGSYVVHWNGKDNTGQLVSAGVYFARLQSVDGAVTRKLVLIK